MSDIPELVSPEDISNQPSELPVDSRELVSDEDLNGTQTEPKEPPGKYNTFGQQTLAGLEGAGEGFAGPLATLAEKGLSSVGVPGLSDEDITERAEANPWTHGITKAAGLGVGLMTGMGEAGLISKGVGAVVNVGKDAGMLARIGSTALKGALETGLIQGGDEISKAMLGQGGDPTSAVATALAVGGVLGVPLGIAGVSANKLAETERAINGAKFLGEFGDRWTQRSAPDWFFNQPKTNTAGGELADMLRGNMSKKIIEKATDAGATSIGGAIGGIPGAIKGHIASEFIEPLLTMALGKPLQKLSNIAVSAAVKVLGEGDTNALYKVLEYAKGINKGEKMVNSYVDSLFKSGRQAISDEMSDNDKNKLEKWLDKGGANQDISPAPIPEQEFANGGEVQPAETNPIADHYPAQNMLLNAAKGRVSQYLTSLRPNKNEPKLPFDNHHEDPHKQREYDRALGIAAKPMSLFNKMKNGSLSVEEVKHMTQMYPELYSHLGKKITERMTNAQIDDEKPTYRVRQSMSLFLGTPLDSTMTPSSIIAAQSAFLPQQPSQQPNQPQGKTKKGTSTLGKSNNSYKTPIQAADSDRQRPD